MTKFEYRTLKIRILNWLKQYDINVTNKDAGLIASNWKGKHNDIITVESIEAAIDKSGKGIYVNFTMNPITIASPLIGDFTLQPSGNVISANLETAPWDKYGIRRTALHSVVGLPSITIEGLYLVVTQTALLHIKDRMDVVAPSTSTGVKRAESSSGMRGRIVSYPGFYNLYKAHKQEIQTADMNIKITTRDGQSFFVEDDVFVRTVVGDKEITTRYPITGPECVKVRTLK